MIELINIKKRFANKFITNGVNLKIPKGKATCIIGRSGEGKSVLLKQIMGLIKPTSGKILIDNLDITDLTGTELQAVHNKCGYVFQFAALLDSLTIFENIAISLFEENLDKEKALEIVLEKLELVNLNSNILNKYPCELSGGMRKRVGLARTLINNPSIILYDEPTTGLDPITAKVVHELIRSLQERYGVTSVIVSHDIEIFKYVDYVALLHEGQIKYTCPAQEIWQSDNPFVYQFIRGLTEGPIKADTKL